MLGLEGIPSLETFLKQPVWMQLGIAYLGGVLTSLTPCVYPLIPITLSLFGVTRDTSWKSGFKLASIYVLGIAITYTVLGLIAGLTGQVFGALLTHPVTLIILSIFFLALAFFTLDLIKLPILSTLQTKAQGVGGSGAKGALLMGLVSGVVAAPCVGPVLALILAVAASTSNVFFLSLITSYLFTWVWNIIFIAWYLFIITQHAS